jgi:ABC-2 type transport system permease protein
VRTARAAVARRALADSRTRTISFALLFAALAAANAVGYRKTYPTVADRLRFVHAFGDNKSVRLFYGVPHDLLTVGGYVAWRVGGTLSIFAAVWGMLAAVRAMRTEEDSGRQELVLAGIVGRGGAFAASLVAIAAGAAVLWLATFLGLVASSLPAGGSAYLALAVVAVVPVFVGVGALASQLASNRRIALELGGGAVAAAFLVRVVADTSSLTALRWATPLGWIEELRAFAGPRPAVLLLPVAAGAVLLGVSAVIALYRDIGSGLLPARDDAEPRFGLLGSPTAQALRSERGSLIAWLLATGAFAFVLGVIANSVSSAGLSQHVQQELAKLGASAIATPAGYLGFTFLFFILAISLFCCSQVAMARREESDQQLETLLALPVGRRGWLAGRLLLAAGAAVVLSLVAGLLAWAGAASQGAPVSAAEMLKAGANCLPTALLFLGIGALAFATLPRAATGIAYGVTSLAFVWELFAGLVGAPAWTLSLSPFHHIGLIPAEPFRAGAAAVMLAIAAGAAAAALWAFGRRDLTGA